MHLFPPRARARLPRHASPLPQDNKLPDGAPDHRTIGCPGRDHIEVDPVSQRATLLVEGAELELVPFSAPLQHQSAIEGEELDREADQGSTSGTDF